ncbi:hypothetical protein GLYMA_05G076100v4 [Glycine max]|uniref:Uncharacterized protein n=2 Tax=Glycine subgen. Soja TaxID=1462606 RepID=A0A0R0JRY3_SOYBN|nr:hypothetical protein GYH30_011906 [Glycine max]KRH57660.1 hypothetical protein GLYMA_05G076100v4 [Glycine max]RZC11448.1 hypothetical protein D0Y65_011579 [Glycine soja]
MPKSSFHSSNRSHRFLSSLVTFPSINYTQALLERRHNLYQDIRGCIPRKYQPVQKQSPQKAHPLEGNNTAQSYRPSKKKLAKLL